MAQTEIKNRLGELLVADGVITEEQLKAALIWQKNNPGMRIGEALVDLLYTDVRTIIKTLAKQRSLSGANSKGEGQTDRGEGN